MSHGVDTAGAQIGAAEAVDRQQCEIVPVAYLENTRFHLFTVRVSHVVVPVVFDVCQPLAARFELFPCLAMPLVQVAHVRG